MLNQLHSSPADWARRLADTAPAPLASRRAAAGPVGCAPEGVEERLAVAWALKDLCYAAWSSEPQRAVRAADALQALAQRAGRRKQALPEQEIAALAAWTAGIAHVTRGRLADALAAFDRAHSTFRRLGCAAHAAATQVPRIMALSMLGEYDAAIACAERTQREFVALRDRRAAAKVSVNLGALHVLRGVYGEAVRHSREAAVLFARVGDHEHSVMADINMAHALTSLGDFDEALRIFARADMRAAAHRFPVLQAMVEEAVAALRLARGQYGQALAGFEGARRRYEALSMPQELAVAERQLADAYLELRLLPEALELLDQSLARFRVLDRPDEVAWTLAQRARVRALLGKSDAAEIFVEATALFARQGNAAGASAVLLARAELALAGAEAGPALDLATQAGHGFAELGQLDARLRADLVRAHALLLAGSVEQAQALFESTLAHARELKLLSVQVRCHTGCGLAMLGRGESVQAEAAFRAAVELFEAQRAALPDAAIRSAFLGDHLRPYQELVRLALDAHACSPGPDAAAEVLRRLDRCRARALSEQMVQAPGGGADSPTTGRLRARLNWLARKAERAQLAGEPTGSLIDELRHTEQALLEQARRERLAGPAPAADDNEFDPAQLQRHLGAGDALVEYGVQDEELFACIVTANVVTVHRQLARWRDVQDALRSARFQIETLRHGALPVAVHLTHLTERARARLRRLHALVWAPLAPRLEPCTRVLVVPHGQLGSLPFAALEGPGGCLAERHELALAPSARLALRGLAQAPAAPRRVLALGESARLPHAGHEARAVADLLGGTAHIGKEATIARLQADAAEADLIHLACHAQFRSDNPVFSALHLHDGPLSVDLVETLGLTKATVVLSGCETGLAEASRGDEMVGLVRAFLIAGAARVVASLWPVDDAVTAQFMGRFYSALRRGEAPATALAEAQRALMDQHPHPLYWAAFTLYGGW